MWTIYHTYNNFLRYRMSDCVHDGVSCMRSLLGANDPVTVCIVLYKDLNKKLM